MRWGYARCSTLDQSLDIQLDDLNKAVCERIIQEKVSGKNIEDRPELQMLLRFMREGDELFVCRIDRLARSVADLCAIAKQLDEKQCRLVIIHQNLDTTSSYGKFLLHILGSVAEFERELLRERQKAGISRWQERLRTGEATRPKRTPKFDHEEIRRLFHHNMSARAIAKKTGATLTTVYRILELNAPNPTKSGGARAKANGAATGDLL